MASLVPAAVAGSQWERLAALVLDSVSSAHSRRAYAQALREFFGWYRMEGREPFSRAVVQAYRVALERRGLAASTINVRLAAVRKLAAEAADNGLLAPEVAAGIARVRGVRKLGVRAGNWLTREQAAALVGAADAETMKGKRDRAMLALLVGCGLRRAELVRLRVEEIVQREGRAAIVDLEGKGGRVRTAPVPAWVAEAIGEWKRASGIGEGLLFRAVSKGGRIGASGLSEKAVWFVVESCARRAGLGKVAPHDLRRTCAKLCRAAGGELEQIQLLLGHASVQTTERYLGTQQELARAVNDAWRI